MNIVLFGAPGSGKGSQAKLMQAEFGWPQISTGDLLREHISKGTELGKIAKEYMDKGMLVPDKLVVALVKDRLSKKDCEKGYVLDGYPRTYEQATELEKFAKIDVVIFIDITMNEVEKRALSRRICPKCGKIFNLMIKMDKDCDSCGTKLIQRDDDKIEVVRERIKTYLAQSEPLIEYYTKKKILTRIFSGNSPEETFQSVKNIISSKRKK
jgi:adenylate kinase